MYRRTFILACLGFAGLAQAQNPADQAKIISIQQATIHTLTGEVNALKQQSKLRPIRADFQGSSSESGDTCAAHCSQKAAVCVGAKTLEHTAGGGFTFDYWANASCDYRVWPTQVQCYCIALDSWPSP